MKMLPLCRSAIVIALIQSTLAAQSASLPGTGTTEPTPAMEHAVGYYDPGLRRVVLISGAGDPKQEDRDKVWSWSGTRWEPLPEAGPSARVNASAAFDVARGKAIVAGGSRKTGATWEVVGDSWESGPSGWQRIADLAPRDHHSLVEDERGGVLTFGGIPAKRADPWPTDTWRLEAGAWTRVATEGPSGRGRTALAFDRKRRQVVLFGGVDAAPAPNQPQAFLNDTWIWEGKGWRKAADGSPAGRYAHGMVFDERANVVLLYGGAAAHRNAPLSDMWQWDGTRWTEIPLTSPTPGYRYQPVMVYDRVRDRTVLVGGIGGPGDTWEWDGKQWRQIAVADARR